MLSQNTLSNEVHLALSRLGYGPSPRELGHYAELTLKDWVDHQLFSPLTDSREVIKRLNAIKIPIKYDEHDGKWEAKDEQRSLESSVKPLSALTQALFNPDLPMAPQEKGLLRSEVILSTLMRSVYSPFPLREVMVQFWHDHFHVNAYSDDHIAIALPTYDREVIRKHCFGNFRQFLEAVATSSAMQYYLSNHSSRAGAANENYARELFELHSFGREHYLNDLYDHWREVPGALKGQPEGYIDQDVYEAARAFTGWTVENGASIDHGRKLPLTGNFTYVESWHDGYQKRVLGHEFDPFRPPMADGREVLDLIASHPATARHLAQKLCQRLLGPNPPETLITKAAELWLRKAQSEQQIAEVVRLIVLSPEFLASAGKKVRRPLSLMASFMRALDVEFIPTLDLGNQLANAGQKLFGATTPVGLPDENALFIGTNAMRQRFNLIMGLAQNRWKNGTPDSIQALQSWGGRIDEGENFVSDWFSVFGSSLTPVLLSQVIDLSGLKGQKPRDVDPNKLVLVPALAAMAPAFQKT